MFTVGNKDIKLMSHIRRGMYVCRHHLEKNWPKHENVKKLIKGKPNGNNKISF